MKIIFLIIGVIIAILSFIYIPPYLECPEGLQLDTTCSFGGLTESSNYEYSITSKTTNAGTTAKDLILTRTDIDNPTQTISVDLTEKLHYTHLTKFTDFKIHTYENNVFVSWLTIGQDWSDVFLAVSDDYGKTFDIKNISQTKTYIDHYKISFSDNSVYVAYHDEFKTEENKHISHLKFTKSDNYGKSFGQHILLNTFTKSAYEFDLESMGENIFVVWREDFDTGENNVWFAASTDRAEWFEREAKMIGRYVDVDSFNGTLHFTWISLYEKDQIWYGYSDDLGVTMESKMIFDADWELSPYADRPRPIITAGEETIIQWTMNNDKGEKTPYTLEIPRND